MKFGISISDFWEMTPRETILAFEAAAWRMRQEQARTLSLAWHVAALSRARKLPPLSRMINSILKPPKNEPLDKRREEFEEMKRHLAQVAERKSQGAEKSQG